MSYPAGPRCTPIVDGDKLYTLGGEGNLICFQADSGEIVWQKDLPKEYDTKTALWGYASHPLIDGKKLIVLAGGEGTHAVALDKNTGAEIWRSSSSPEQGYSPPTIIEAGGKRQLLLARPNALQRRRPRDRPRDLDGALRGHERLDHHVAGSLGSTHLPRRLLE